MRKLVGMSLAVVLTIFLAFGTAFAQASAKATAQCGELNLVPLAASYETIFTQTIKMPEQKDLIIGVSLECGLTTNTKVMSKSLEKALAEAEAMVKVRVLVDPVYDPDTGELLNLEEALAAPGEVIFARRTQTLIAEFAGDISDCISLVDTNGDGIPDSVVVDEDCVEPETLQLILDTMSANSFNFIVMDLGAGEHEIVVQADLTYNTDTEVVGDSLAEAIATAYVGKGSVTIEDSRMIKDEDVEL